MPGIYILWDSTSRCAPSTCECEDYRQGYVTALWPRVLWRQQLPRRDDYHVVETQQKSILTHAPPVCQTQVLWSGTESHGPPRPSIGICECLKTRILPGFVVQWTPIVGTKFGQVRYVGNYSPSDSLKWLVPVRCRLPIGRRGGRCLRSPTPSRRFKNYIFLHLALSYTIGISLFISLD